MVVSLPLDVWREVASYLSQHCLQAYFSVNSAFFTIAMEAKYSVVCFGNIAARRYIECLLLPIASHHIRTLHLRSPVIPNIPNPGKLAKAFRRITNDVTRTTPQWEQLAKVIHNMSGIGSKLRVLRIHLSVAFCRIALSPSMTFPCLEEFFVVLSCEFLTTDAMPTLTEVFAPFLNNHHLTLRTLHIHWHPIKYTRLNISAFLLRLHHFSQLHTFELSHDFISIQESDGAGLQHVLELHMHQLRKLSLYISPGGYQEGYCLKPTPRKWYEQGFLQVRLTKLQELDLAMQMFTQIDKTATYLHQFESTLTSLTLKNRCLTYNDVKTLVEAFASQNILQKLGIAVYILSPSLLALVAQKLSNLESLSLRHRFLRSPSALEFCRTINSHVYHRWKLHDLSIISDEWGRNDLRMCEQALKVAFPGLETLRVDYVPAEDGPE